MTAWKLAWSRHGVGGADQGMVEDGKIKAWLIFHCVNEV